VLTAATQHTAYVRHSEGMAVVGLQGHVTATRAYCTGPVCPCLDPSATQCDTTDAASRPHQRKQQPAQPTYIALPTTGLAHDDLR
jgi:hypothetical protein